MYQIKCNLCAIHCIYNTANGIYNRNVCMNVNHIKRKIDIEKIHYKNTLDSLQTNCVVMNLLFAIYLKRYKAISLVSHAKG